MRSPHDGVPTPEAYLGGMELFIFVTILVALALSALRWGVDSRVLLERPDERLL